MIMDKPKTEKLPSLPEYTGTKVYSVAHHAHGAVKVRARSYAEAVITAAMVWGQRWQDYAFYAFCDVTEHKKPKKAKRSAADELS